MPATGCSASYPPPKLDLCKLRLAEIPSEAARLCSWENTASLCPPELQARAAVLGRWFSVRWQKLRIRIHSQTMESVNAHSRPSFSSQPSLPQREPSHSILLFILHTFLLTPTVQLSFPSLHRLSHHPCEAPCPCSLLNLELWVMWLLLEL